MKKTLIILSLLPLMWLFLKIEAFVQKRETSCPPDRMICSKSLNYLDTKQFECHNNCPSGYKCCPDTCFEHNICKKAVVNSEAHFNPKSLDNYLFIENEEDCPIDKKVCSTPLDVEFTKKFICHVGQCPEGYKCCSDSCFSHKICKRTAITPPEPSACPRGNKICSEPLEFEKTRMFVCHEGGCPENYKCCPHSCFQHHVCQLAESDTLLPTSGATGTTAIDADFDISTATSETTETTVTTTGITTTTVATTLEESDEEEDYDDTDDNDKTTSTTSATTTTTTAATTTTTTITTSSSLSTVTTTADDSGDENDYDDSNNSTTLSSVATTMNESDEDLYDDYYKAILTLMPSTSTESRVESSLPTDISNTPSSISTTITTLGTVTTEVDESDENDYNDNNETISTRMPSSTTTTAKSTTTTRVKSTIMDQTTSASIVSIEGNVSQIQSTTVGFTSHAEGSGDDDNDDYEDESDYDESSTSVVQDATTEQRGFFNIFN